MDKRSLRWGSLFETTGLPLLVIYRVLYRYWPRGYTASGAWAEEVAGAMAKARTAREDRLPCTEVTSWGEVASCRQL